MSAALPPDTGLREAVGVFLLPGLPRAPSCRQPDGLFLPQKHLDRAKAKRVAVRCQTPAEEQRRIGGLALPSLQGAALSAGVYFGQGYLPFEQREVGSVPRRKPGRSAAFEISIAVRESLLRI